MKLVIPLSICAIVMGCAEPAREEVLSRFDGGEKQVVAVYRGSGANEVLVERQTYDQSGELVLVEHLESGTTQTFIDLHPEVKNATGLSAFLAGEWHEHKHSSIGEAWESREHLRFRFAGATVEAAATYQLVSDGEVTEATDTLAVSYSDGLRLSMDVTEAERDSNDVSGHTDNPQPLSAFFEVEIAGPQQVMLRPFAVYEGDIRLPSSVTKLYRSEQASESEQRAWGIEYEAIADEIGVQRQALIEQHFPDWAARQQAESDRRIADILDDANYRRERSEKLLALLMRIGMSFEDYRTHTSMSEDEFSRTYLFAPDGTIPREAADSPWVVSEDRNPIDDSTTVTLINSAKSGRSRLRQEIALVIRCLSKRTELYINWHDYLGSDAINVLTRVGGDAASTQRWTLSTDSQATFYPSGPTPFIKQLIGADEFVAQVTPYNESPVIAVWDLSGLSEAIEPLRTTCNW
jgi:type VI secretion system protein VasI